MTEPVVPERAHFEAAYQGLPPWDIGRPQQPFEKQAEKITGTVLDVGCGTGENALFFASRGQSVTGVDYLEAPIAAAKEKAAARSLQATFLVRDALTLDASLGQFDSVIDSGLFHCFSNADRARYVAALAQVLKPGGHAFLMCFSTDEPGTQGPRRVSRWELHGAFDRGWIIESMLPCRFEVRPDLKDVTFTPGGPHAWFVTVRRE